MRVTADTNVLLRATIADEPKQARAAHALLHEAELVVMPLVALCEFVWVATRVYRRSLREVGDVIRVWLASPTVQIDRAAAEAGLAMLDAGGDFADAVIAFTGRQLGGAVFASFDRKAVGLVAAAGGEARLLTES